MKCLYSVEIVNLLCSILKRFCCIECLLINNNGFQLPGIAILMVMSLSIGFFHFLYIEDANSYLSLLFSFYFGLALSLKRVAMAATGIRVDSPQRLLAYV